MEPTRKSYPYKLNQFNDAVNGFAQAITVEVKGKSAVEADLINNGKVQKFEYCVELAWKLARMFLFDIHGLERNSPKSAAKGLLEVQLIDDNLYQHFIEMLNDRNRMSHVYDLEDFSEILDKLKLHSECLQALSEGFRRA